MSATLTYLGHSAVLIRAGEHSLLIDPFLTGNPKAPGTAGLTLDDIPATHIALTHGHNDHVGDAPAIARRTGATIHAAFELCNVLAAAHGLERFEPMNPGGRVSTPFGFIALTQAFHSSSYSFEGREHYTGQPCGVVARIGGVTLYHCGDTALFSDLRLIGELYKPDLALIPCGDRFTMGPEHAARAAELIAPRLAVPIHFNTWPPIEISLERFAPEGVQIRPMKPGETIKLSPA